MAGLLDRPLLHALVPIVFLVLSSIIAVPPLLLHIAINPHLYILTTTPISTRITALRQKLFYYVWRILAPALEPGEADIKRAVLPKCYGVVMEPGAGIGSNIKFYDRSKVSRLILVEPNVNMHPKLRGAANACGYHESDGSLLLLGCGAAAADEHALAAAGLGEGSLDSVASIHVLCGIPGPAGAIEMYRRMLKPGGVLAFFEHVRSEAPETAGLQDWYTRYIWPHAFDGCHLNRPTGEWIVRGPAGAEAANAMGRRKLVDGETQSSVKERWSEYHVNVPKGQPKYTCIPNVYGYALKA